MDVALPRLASESLLSWRTGVIYHYIISEISGDVPFHSMSISSCLPRDESLVRPSPDAMYTAVMIPAPHHTHRSTATGHQR